MPELPEVETTRRGIAPLVVDKIVTKVLIHNASLRWPVPAELIDVLPQQQIRAVSRRSKYLLFVEIHILLLSIKKVGNWDS